MNSLAGQVKTIIRKVLVRNPDGTTRIVNETTTIQPKPAESQPQKIQVMRQADGKLSVRGLQANQKLVQTPDGKYIILPANSSGKFTENLFKITKFSLKLKFFLKLSEVKLFIKQFVLLQQQQQQLQYQVQFNNHHRKLLFAQFHRKQSLQQVQQR